MYIFFNKYYIIVDLKLKKRYKKAMYQNDKLNIEINQSSCEASKLGKNESKLLGKIKKNQTLCMALSRSLSERNQ